MGKQSTVIFGEETRRQIADLRRWWGETITAVLARCVDRAWHQEQMRRGEQVQPLPAESNGE